MKTSQLLTSNVGFLSANTAKKQINGLEQTHLTTSSNVKPHDHQIANNKRIRQDDMVNANISLSSINKTRV